jgi:hypothetical protein
VSSPWVGVCGRGIVIDQQHGVEQPSADHIPSANHANDITGAGETERAQVVATGSARSVTTG